MHLLIRKLNWGKEMKCRMGNISEKETLHEKIVEGINGNEIKRKNSGRRHTEFLSMFQQLMNFHWWDLIQPKVK